MKADTKAMVERFLRDGIINIHHESDMEEFQAIIAALRSTEAAEAYAKQNPLGGPATMFRAIADRIQAGEDYYAVLADYGLRHSEASSELALAARALIDADRNSALTTAHVNRLERALMSPKSEAVERWIPVSERLPETHEFVLIYQPDAGSQHRIAYHDGHRWKWPYSFNCEHPCGPTHWMPCPHAPLESK